VHARVTSWLTCESFIHFSEEVSSLQTHPPTPGLRPTGAKAIAFSTEEGALAESVIYTVGIRPGIYKNFSQRSISYQNENC